ncbi:MAG: hypothetical protein ACREA4_09795 [Nitrososphaera sp.]
MAILGGWGAAWYQMRNARKNRMNEIIAERKVTVNAEAFAVSKDIEASLIQKGVKDTLQRVLNQEEWFFNNRLFLPGNFPAKWLAIRTDLSQLARWLSDVNIETAEKVALETKIRNCITEAIDEIYKDMDLIRIKVDDTNTI